MTAATVESSSARIPVPSNGDLSRKGDASKGQTVTVGATAEAQRGEPGAETNLEFLTRSRLLLPQGFAGVDPHRAHDRHALREERDGEQQQRHACERDGIDRAHVEERRFEISRGGGSQRGASGKTREND